MSEQKLYQAPAGWLASAVEALCGAGVAVVAPVEHEPGVVDLRPVTPGQALAGEYGTVTVPMKQLFFPITEVLLDFAKTGDGDVDVETAPAPSPDEVVVFGARPCDSAALAVMEKVFYWDYDDVRYRARRDRTTVVAFACDKPRAECFCTSVGGSPHGTAGSDAIVFLAPDGGALLRVLTDKGQALAQRLGGVLQEAPPDAAPPAAPELEPKFDPAKVKEWLDQNFENDFWAERALACLGCRACTFLCPTCHCFDIVDEGQWNQGQRRRNWDCCSHPEFTLHASGHNPRATQPARFRQRILHKFKYFPERFEMLACVGCGRCVRACSAGQNLPDLLSHIETK